MNLDPQHILIAAGVFAIAFFAVKFLWKADTAIEERRKAAILVSAALSAKGLTILPRILTDYAVGDYSGMAKEISRVAVVLTHNPGAIETEFEQVFSRVLLAKISDPKARQALLTQINSTP